MAMIRLLVIGTFYFEQNVAIPSEITYASPIFVVLIMSYILVGVISVIIEVIALLGEVFGFFTSSFYSKINKYWECSVKLKNNRSMKITVIHYDRKGNNKGENEKYFEKSGKRIKAIKVGEVYEMEDDDDIEQANRTNVFAKQQTHQKSRGVKFSNTTKTNKETSTKLKEKPFQSRNFIRTRVNALLPPSSIQLKSQG